MKFALVEGGRQEATPASRGECPGCGAGVIAKCGTLIELGDESIL